MQENHRRSGTALQHRGVDTVDVESPLTDREIPHEPLAHH
jgi:hypothetical protein